jgi:hypothetical protein
LEYDKKDKKLPPVSIANQTRREKFLNYLISPFLPQTVNSMDSSEWDHLASRRSIEPEKGTVAYVEDPRFRWLYDKIRVEQDRLSTLTDIRIMLDEAPYIDGVCNKFCLWATVDKPKITFAGGSEKRAEKITNELLERIEYHSRRGDYLYNGLFLESFLKKQISITAGVTDQIFINPSVLAKEFGKGLSLGRIDDILGPLTAETVFRNSDKQDKFPAPSQAFYQVPEEYNNPNTPVSEKPYKDWFHQMMIIHPRWNHRRQKSHRYSRPALKPIRKAYNRTELSATDAVVQRHLAASRLLVIYLSKTVESGGKPGVSQDQIDAFINDYLLKYPKGFSRPGEVYVTSGDNEVESVGDLNITLSKPADIFMHFDFMSVGLMLHPMLAGYMGGEGGRVSGPLLEQLKKNLEVEVASVNAWENREQLLPIIYFELFMNGIFDTEVIITNDRFSFESKDVRRKTKMSEVESQIRSRRHYYEEEIMPETGTSWEEYSKDIKKEFDEFGQAKPSENVNKGISGSKKDAATTPPEAEE